MKTEHTTFRNNSLFCLNCGGSHPLQMPVEVSKMSKLVKAFNVLHNDCPKTWSEPSPNQSKSIPEKAMFWINNGEIGMSSKTMWNYFFGNKDFRIDIPWDPDDFSRCYKLLLFVPEWKQRVSELATLSEQWKNLAENWDKLTEMYEQNVRENWKNSKKIGMYDFMQTLIR